MNEKVESLVIRVADRVVFYGTQHTNSGNYLIAYNNLADIISAEDYKRYFDLIADEIASREEVLDLQPDPVIGELDCNFGLSYCPCYEWVDGDEEIFGCSREEWEKTATMPVALKSTFTKEALKLLLQQGRTFNDLLVFVPGQECEIYKADDFRPGDTVIYIPDVCLNSIPIDRPIRGSEELAEVLSSCYTGQDFIDECSGNVEKAEHLFWYCDWQHPSSAADELADDEEE